MDGGLGGWALGRWVAECLVGSVGGRVAACLLYRRWSCPPKIRLTVGLLVSWLKAGGGVLPSGFLLARICKNGRGF